MKISNVRMGFATNSSSSHSIVIAAKAQATNNRDTEYGWENFCLKSKNDKMNYMAASLYTHLKNMKYDSKTAFLITTGLFPKTQINEDSCVDHQSVLSFPIKRSRYYNSGLDFDFVKEFAEYIVNNKHISICGGNDNEEPYDYGGQEVLLEYPRECDVLWSRKDKGWWTLFNYMNGTKIRISFEKEPSEYLFSTYPELVDIKITDYCPFGCSFCYQSSTIKGEHATMNNLQDIMHYLNKMQVFEVALGGGETTMHPQFTEIIEMFHMNHIVVNFTTFSFKEWAKKPHILEAVKKYVGAIALSVSDNEWDKIGYAEKVCNDNNLKLHIQCVLGILGTKEIIQIIEKIKDTHCVNALTLLGYKKYGRGIDLLNNTKLKKIDMTAIIQAAKNNNVNLGLDTLAVQTYQDSIIEAEIPASLTTKTEGTFSMYIDAVKQFIAKDSYSDKHFYYKTDQELMSLIRREYPFR